MTPEEYDALSERFAAKNAELLRALDADDQAETDRLRAEFTALRAEVDAAHHELNGTTPRTDGAL